MPRITILDEHSFSSKPIGVFAWMIQLEGKKRNFVNFLLISGMIYLIYVDVVASNTQNRFGKLSRFFVCVKMILQMIWILKLRSQRWQYIELIEIFENQTRCNLDNTGVYRHLTKVRRLYSCLFTVIMLSVSITILIKPVMVFRNSNDYISFGKGLTFGLINAVCLSIILLDTQFLVESCLHVHACWLTVNEQIRLLKNIDSRALASVKIRQVRSMYSIAAVFTEKMDSFLRLPITIFFTSLVISHFSFFVQVWTAPSIIGFVHFVLRASVLSIVSWNMIYIHYLSNKSFGDIYLLSYGKHSLRVNHEIHLFLDRIGQSSVGFSFLKISLITPTFVTTLASTTLTFVLSLPSL